MKSMPLITIITVVFNGEKYIENTIISIISQKYKNIEFIIIDGGSKDKTLDIIKKYKEYVSVLVSENDEGLSDAMNKGMDLASGDWILYLHADDTFTNENSLQDLLSVSFENDDIVWITGYLNFQDENNVVYKSDHWHKISWFDMILRNIIRHQATLVKREAVLNTRFRKQFKYAMDYDFFLRLWKGYGDPKVVNRHIINFRLDGNNLSSNYYASIKDEMKARLIFRKENHQYLWLPFDYLIFSLRYMKIKFIHDKQKHVR